MNAFEYSDAYFLPYDDFLGERYSYAVSIGSKENVYDAELKEKISRWVSYYKVLSVRDCKTKDFLVNVGGQMLQSRIRFDCDPTLLLSKKDWMGLINACKIEVPKSKYILFYDLSRNNDNWDLACSISKKLPLIRTFKKYLSQRIIFIPNVSPNL